ncbi:pilus (MSHA type) biogenesis protein MshL [Aquabacterium sp.]|uniref:pilus (MSHA type) biogenesis protein MshL n=1 Tax=Aquabacterium sp. TaxID=1872578 RepID=UPI002E336517|nr:pilus (MSHA type) biogenesis protein MshL [Aquabacterium sp.]HEX5311625.1 pilus (MSHA type) biogenesis protein MshL [Aquabacterium sp.]
MKPMQTPSQKHRQTWRLTLVAAVAVLLSACASKPPAPTVTQEAIDEAMKAAAAKRPVAKTPDNVMSALVPPTVERPRVAKRESRFDLVFNNASINQVFEAIAAGSRYSFVVQPGFTNTVAVNLKDVTAIEALEVLREVYGFEYRVSGNRVFVEPPTLQTRIFQVAYPSSKRSGRSDTRVSSGSITNNLNSSGSGGGSAGGSTTANEGSQVSTSIDTDFWKELDAALKAIVGDAEGRQIVLSQHTGVVVVRGMPRQLREVESFLKSSKLSIERQVMLEAKIVEVTLKDGYQSGINWTQLNGEGNHRISVGSDPSRVWVPGALGRKYGVPDGAIKTIVDPSTTPPTVIPTSMADLVATPLSQATNGVLGLAFSTDSFYGLLSFLETQGSVQVLSSPRVAAINNQKAVLRVGTDDFFVTNIATTTTTSASGTVTTPTITAQPFFSGISLDVTPQIDAEGMVTMHVRPSVSNVSERAHVINLGTLGSFSLPLASSSVNETDTIVRVQDGYIVAIGGLMHQEQDNTKSQVPFLGDLPVVGNLFKQNNRNMKKSELVFLIKPTVIKSDADWRQDLADVGARLEGMVLPSHSVRERAGE